MKSLLAALAIAAAFACAARAQLPQGTNVVATNANVDLSTPVVISRDANTRVWARVTPIATVLTTRS